MRDDLAVIIPAFNEAGTIASVVRSVVPLAHALVVDDASRDGTGAQAAAAGAVLVTLSRNAGYEGALSAGFARAVEMGFSYAITYDADGQFHVGDLAAVIAALSKDRRKLVLGQREHAARFGEALFNRYTSLRFGVPDILCGMKGYDLALFRKHGRFGNGRSVGTELALSALRDGVEPALVPVRILPREQGAPRFGQGFRANRILMRALLDSILADFQHRYGRFRD